MTEDLTWLSATVALFFVYLLGEVVLGNIQYTPKELLGSRDGLAPNNPALARAKRATSNMVEAMCMFVPLVLIAAVTGKSNEMTAYGAMTFFFARVAYAPLYWFGVPTLRTLAWFAGVIGLIMIFLQVLPFSGAA
ncbi:MAG: MAPEG family protein [Hyphomonas sp.]|nr:MAPEG family protein [Hyphomonas sp.]